MTFHGEKDSLEVLEREKNILEKINVYRAMFVFISCVQIPQQ